MSYEQPPGNYDGQQPGYGQQPYNNAPVQQSTHPLAIVSLVLGIIGLCCSSWFVISLGAAITGFLGRKKIKESPQYKGDGLALAGLILGVIGIALGILIWILIGTGVIDMDYYANMN